MATQALFPFLKMAPLCVMARAAIQFLLDPDRINKLFRRGKPPFFGPVAMRVRFSCLPRREAMAEAEGDSALGAVWPGFIKLGHRTNPEASTPLQLLIGSPWTPCAAL